MMDVMRNHINFFWYNVNSEVLGKEPPEFIAELKSPVCAIPVVPNGAMGTHYYHAVQKRGEQHPGAHKLKEEQQEKRYKTQYFKPAKKRQPVFSGTEYIEPAKKFTKNLSGVWFY
jgi:hypothetical protein